MQFQIDYKVGDKFITVKLSNLLKPDATSSLIDSFERIGGHGGPLAVDWKFPLFVTSELLEEIIRNTCFECGGLMKDGEALDNTWIGFDDFGGDTGQPGTTISKIGHPEMKKVRKCSSCGHSHT